MILQPFKDGGINQKSNIEAFVKVSIIYETNIIAYFFITFEAYIIIFDILPLLLNASLVTSHTA